MPRLTGIIAATLICRDILQTDYFQQPADESRTIIAASAGSFIGYMNTTTVLNQVVVVSLCVATRHASKIHIYNTR